MSDDVINLALKLEADERAAKKAEAQVNKIIKSLEKLKKTTKDPIERANIQKSIDLYKKEGIQIEKANEELAKREAIQKKQIALIEKSIKVRQKGQKVEQTSLQIADERFSKTTKDVALAGDVESNLRAVGGAAGALGAGAGVQRGVGAVAELPAVIEALPRLKESLAGLPQTITAAVKSIGLTAGIAGGALIGAVALLAWTSSQAAKEIKALSDAQQTRIDNIISEVEISRMSTEELLALQQESAGTIGELQQKTSALVGENKQLTDAYDGTFKSMRETAVATTTTGDSVDELNTELETSESNLAAVNAELERRNDLDTGAVDKAREIGDLRRLENDALDRTSEANRDRLADLAQEGNILKEQIASLRASGDTSQRATDELANLEAQLKKVGQESGIVSGAIGKVGETINQDAQKSANKIAQIQQQIAQETVKASQATAQAQAEASAKRQATIDKFQADSFKKRGQILKEFNRSVLAAELKAKQDERRAKANQDFKALFELEETQSEEAQARVQARTDKLADLQESIKEERKKLLTETKVKIKAGNNQLANLNKQLHAEIASKNAAAKAVVELEIERGKAIIDINRSVSSSIIALWRQVPGSNTTVNNNSSNQSLTVNGDDTPLKGNLFDRVRQIVIDTNAQMGIN